MKALVSLLAITATLSLLVLIEVRKLQEIQHMRNPQTARAKWLVGPDDGEEIEVTMQREPGQSTDDFVVAFARLVNRWQTEPGFQVYLPSAEEEAPMQATPGFAAEGGGEAGEGE